MHGRIWALSLAALGLALAGCGGDDDGGLGGLGANASEEDIENAVEDAIEDAASDSGDDQDVNIDLDADGGSGEISFEGDDGQSVSLGGGELPDGFPDDFPLPDDFEQTIASGDGSSFFLSGTSSSSLDDLDDFYADALPDAGYDIDERIEFGSEASKIVSFTFSGDGRTGVVQVSVDVATGTTLVNLTLEEDG